MKLSFIKLILGFGFVLFFFSGMIAQASTITVNFDNPPFPSMQTGVVVEGIFTDANHNPVGVGPYNILPCACADTPPNAAFGYPLNPAAMVVSGVKGSFWVSVGSRYVLGGTDFVSFHVVGTVPGQTVLWTVRFYSTDPSSDLSQNVLASFSGTTDQLVSLSTFYPDIQTFIFLPSGPNVFNEGIDTVVFDAPTVPEPGTIGLLSLGLAGASLLKKRLRR